MSSGARSSLHALLRNAPGTITRFHLPQHIQPHNLLLRSIASGSVKVGDPLVAMDLNGVKTEEGKVTRLFARRGMAAIALERASAGACSCSVAVCSPCLPSLRW